MATSNISADVRLFVKRRYLDPARQRGDMVVRIVAGEVHKALNLKNRVPLVCNALASKEFLETNDVVLEKREGPPSGLSTAAVFTFRLTGAEKPSQDAIARFLKLRGIGKATFDALGGGEAFIQSERSQFYGDDS
jgi:hypothetical protein